MLLTYTKISYLYTYLILFESLKKLSNKNKIFNKLFLTIFKNINNFISVLIFHVSKLDMYAYLDVYETLFLHLFSEF